MKTVKKGNLYKVDLRFILRAKDQQEALEMAKKSRAAPDSQDVEELIVETLTPQSGEYEFFRWDDFTDSEKGALIESVAGMIQGLVETKGKSMVREHMRMLSKYEGFGSKDSVRLSFNFDMLANDFLAFIGQHRFKQRKEAANE